jgi:hypothetical protein
VRTKTNLQLLCTESNITEYSLLYPAIANDHYQWSTAIAQQLQVTTINGTQWSPKMDQKNSSCAVEHDPQSENSSSWSIAPAEALMKGHPSACYGLSPETHAAPLQLQCCQDGEVGAIDTFMSAQAASLRLRFAKLTQLARLGACAWC